MNRKALHLILKQVLDKIDRLNDNLREADELHPVEVDLLNAYVKEVVELKEKIVRTGEGGTNDSAPEKQRIYTAG